MANAISLLIHTNISTETHAYIATCRHTHTGGYHMRAQVSSSKDANPLGGGGKRLKIKMLRLSSLLRENVITSRRTRRLLPTVKYCLVRWRWAVAFHVAGQ